MRKIAYSILFLLCLMFLIFGSGCILNARIFDLDMRIKKSQLLNYEFSSELLKLKFQETILQKEDLGSEVNNLIMESNVMNQKLGNIHSNFTWREKIGESIINSIHYLVFKPMIYLAAENEYLFDLQKAFYLEKNQKCNLATPIYEELEIKLRKSSSDDHAFVLLHLGYCNAILGKQESAVSNLSSLLSKYTETHFADSAQVMLNIITSNLKKEVNLGKKNLSHAELARKYYDAALYRKTIDQLKKIESLDAEEKYLKARSLERLGELADASNIYLEVISEGNLELSKRANRRLMLIGNFYEGGEEIKKIAKRNAEKIGDSVLYDFVESAVSKQSKSLVLEELKKESELGNDNRSLLQEEIKLNKDQVEKNDIAMLSKSLFLDEKFDKKKPPSGKKIFFEKARNIKSVKHEAENSDCLQFRSKIGIIYKAEKVLLLDGNFITIFNGKTLATPVSEFELLESCKINSPFTIATDKIGKVSVKTAVIKGDEMILDTESGTKIIKIAEVQSMIPDSILETIRFIIIKRKDGNFHYCNSIEFLGTNDARMNSRSGVSVTKSIYDLDYIQLGENSINFVIYKLDKEVLKTGKNIIFQSPNITFQNELGESEIFSIGNIRRIESE
ncbi:hypothetical protein AB3N58_17520 (plasmid) [Leptospira sp. WS60.C2]